MTVQPGKAVAGELFEQQPIVQLLDGSGVPKKVSTGYALVFMDQSPTGPAETAARAATNTIARMAPQELRDRSACGLPLARGRKSDRGLELVIAREEYRRGEYAKYLGELPG